VSEHAAPARAAAAVLGLQVALFVSLGLPDGALGVAWPSMRGSFDRPLGDLGVVLALNTVGYLGGSTSVAAVARRVGTPVVMSAAMVVAAGAMALWVLTGWWLVLLAAALVLGVSRGATDAGLNAYVALHGGVRRLGVLHGAYGVGTSLGPLVVLVSLAAGTWRPAWIAIAALDAVVGGLTWRWRAAWPADVVVAPPTTDDGDGNGNDRQAGWPAVAVTMACFAALVGAEFSTGTWSYTLLTDGRGMDDTAAGLWVASYWAGLTVARFALGAVGDRFDRVSVLHASCALALIGVGLLWWDPGGTGVFGLPLAGAGFASVFPTLVALMPDRLGVHRSSAVIGWSVAAASLGGTAVAALAGALADRSGPAILAPVLFVVTMALAALHLLLVRLAPVSPMPSRRPVVLPG
jgi:fucose permease